ncbi:TonB-dependent receptor [Croceibacterium mercuriale]|uniref:TonB-dependent receptor n=1 Tax=Croceibacterium mercuriale TaxID=1572751 RepID=A0A0B2BXY5_9SPHN|nr:TonB-dependent receptor [Croceibacterium mercuriale]KHL24867.1 TonB-dependent receptor [Croceibacterium mercuriale]
MPRHVLLAATALITLLPAAALAQQAGNARSTGDDFHGPIVVTAAGLDRLDLLAGTSVVSGLELQRNMNSQIGDVLDKVPGVASTGFVPGAARPILRGLGGDRVRVLVDGLGTADAGNVSDDHGVAIDPLIATSVEVLRGPAVLLYGSQAIGGAVNIITRRLPERRLEEAVHVDAMAGIDDAYDRRQAGASVDLRLTPDLIFHVDGAWQKTNDLEVPGYVLARDLRSDLLADAAEHAADGETDEAAELTGLANQRGMVRNTASEQTSLGTSLNWFSGNSSFAAGFSYFDSDYGVPSRPGFEHAHGEEGEDHDHDHGHEAGEEAGHGEENVTIGLRQYRGDLKGVVDLGTGLFREARTRLAYTDYSHTEFEGDEIGTVFDVETVEGRLELVQNRREGWGGSVGVQFQHINFAATGEEAFVPPNETESIALFTLQEVDLGPAELEAGARYEHTTIDVNALDEHREFDAFSGSLGLSAQLTGALRIGLNGSHAERAPVALELYAEGPHVATQLFEVGNGDLDKERSWGLEGYVRGNLGPARLSASVYRNWFENFIYLTETDEEADGLPVAFFGQQAMDQWGVEAEAQLPLITREAFGLLADVRADYTRATLDDGSPVPRIPPLALLGALEANLGHFDARAEVQWFDDQDRVQGAETTTDSFTFVNLSLAWHPVEGSNNFTLLLQGDNVFDVQGRNHASFTKDYVPLAGRNVRLTARLSL